MARHSRRDDPDRDPSDDDEREHRPPSKRSAAIIIAILVSTGLALIAYFVLELTLDDMGGVWAAAIVMLIGLLVARGGLLR